MRLAKYRVEHVGIEVVAISDQCDGTTLSVTNDAESVVAELNRTLDLGDRRLIYRDTDGRWDELVHERGAFVGFSPIGGSSLAEALEKLGGAS